MVDPTLKEHRRNELPGRGRGRAGLGVWECGNMGIWEYGSMGRPGVARVGGEAAARCP